jgi:hypothetical protein
MKPNFKQIVKEFNAFWIPYTCFPDLLPNHDGLFMIFTDKGVFVKAYYSSRKEIFLSEDGGDGYDALAFRHLTKEEK